MFTFEVSWDGDPNSKAVIEARTPYKAYQEFLKKEGVVQNVLVVVERGSKCETFSNNFEKQKGIFDSFSLGKPKPKSREAIYGKPKNENLGCLWMLFGRYVKIGIIIGFLFLLDKCFGCSFF